MIKFLNRAGKAEIQALILEICQQEQHPFIKDVSALCTIPASSFYNAQHREI